MLSFDETCIFMFRVYRVLITNGMPL